MALYVLPRIITFKYKTEIGYRFEDDIDLILQNNWNFIVYIKCCRTIEHLNARWFVYNAKAMTLITKLPWYIVKYKV